MHTDKKHVVIGTQFSLRRFSALTARTQWIAGLAPPIPF
jgi:hypothetical protein